MSKVESAEKTYPTKTLIGQPVPRGFYQDLREQFKLEVVSIDSEGKPRVVRFGNNVKTKEDVAEVLGLPQGMEVKISPREGVPITLSPCGGRLCEVSVIREPNTSPVLYLTPILKEVAL